MYSSIRGFEDMPVALTQPPAWHLRATKRLERSSSPQGRLLIESIRGSRGALLNLAGRVIINASVEIVGGGSEVLETWMPF